MTRRARRVRGLALTAALLLGAACAPPRLSLPSGDGEPIATEAAIEIGRGAFDACGQVRTLTAELGLSGRAGSQRLRGRLIAGIATPGSIRLEGVAPFGPPVFILAASPAASTLLLPRDDRVLEGADPAAILEALAGVSLGPDDLLVLLAGCPSPRPAVVGGRRHGDEWTVLQLTGGLVAYLRRMGEGWQPTAVVRSDMTIEYSELDERRRPGLVRLVSRDDGPGAFDLRVRLSQVELNADVPDAAFRVKVPPEARPMSLEELRDAGPMRDRTTETAAR